MTNLIQRIEIEFQLFDERRVDESVAVKRPYPVVTQIDGLQTG